MGNGGFAGRIDRPTLAAAAARGDAAAGTDTGHTGDGFDASWARGRPDLVEDYAYRSIKITADAARLLVARYYRRPDGLRYFMGCSYGGRQALVAAARWPADWDGVIAGAPAYRWTETLTGFARIARAVETGDPAARDVIERAGYPAADADPEERRRWILRPDPAGPSQRRFAVEAYRNLFGAGADWAPRRFRPTRDAAPPAVRRAFAIGDLRPFLRRGGKVLSYFGTADAVLPPRSAPVQWRALAAGMGGPAALGRSYRLFLVPGMGHCQGGAAPHAFGQSLPAPAARDDPRHDIRRALERWVERGVAPDELIATDPPAAPRARQRTLRPFSG